MDYLEVLKTTWQEAEEKAEDYAEQALNYKSAYVLTAAAKGHNGKEHDVKITTRYGDTYRECNCILGSNHHEDDSPWVWNGKVQPR